MTVLNYQSHTNFDKTLLLNITESNTGRKTEFRYEGFRDFDEAEKFAAWWEELWHWGYEGKADSHKSDEGKPIVLATRYNSCD